MARDMKLIVTCDPCDEDGFANVPAAATHVLAINGGPEVELDMCARDSLFVERLGRLCKERGRERPQQRALASVKKPKAVKAEPPKEIAPAPETEAAPEKETGRGRKKTEAKGEIHVYVVCPLEHKSEKGGKRRVSYKDRSSHVDQCHGGMKLWDVEWEYPKGLELFHCEVHAECMKTGLAFTSAKGRVHHNHSCKLPRIDTTPQEDP